MGTQQALELLVSFAEMVGGIAMFALGFERRERSRRGALIAGTALPVLLLFSALIAAFGEATYPTAGMSPVLVAFLHAATWMLIPLAAVLVITGLTTAGVWPAVYCAAAGYTLQNLTSGAADFVELVLGGGATEAVPLVPTMVIELACAAVFYACAWRFLAGPLRRHGLAAAGSRRMLVLLGMVFLAVILFDTAVKQLVWTGADTSLVLLLKVVHGVVCVFVLFAGHELLVMERLRQDSAVAQSMLAAERRQYELSRENIEAINIKCHDIRHQIRQLGEGGAHGVAEPQAIEDIAREVSIYDHVMRTGNDALDTILTEKGLVCENEGIAFRCIADGCALSFMAPTDIYALFGNALDNAIEASRTLGEKERRSISLTVREAAGMASIHVENRFAGEVTFGSDGLPLTSKEDRASHGFGTRSMRSCAERYGGVMTTRASGDVFHLNIALPLPE